MRDIKELYDIKGKQGYYSAEAVQGLKFFPHNREGSKGYREAEDGVCRETIRNAQDEFYIIQGDGTKKKAYGIGSYRWSYSKEERDRVREEEKKQREINKRKRVLLERITMYYENMSVDKLERLVEKHGL